MTAPMAAPATGDRPPWGAVAGGPAVDTGAVALLNRLSQRRTVGQLTTLFDLCLVVLDARRPELVGVLRPVLERLDRALGGSDCTVGVLVAGTDATGAARLLGPLADRMAVFADPDGTAVAALGVEGAPALLWITTEPAVRAVAHGWQPARWRAVLVELAARLAWTRPLMPTPGDPAPIEAESIPVTGTVAPAPGARGERTDAPLAA